MCEMTLEARFWAKVDKNGPVPAHRPELGPCWIWTGAKLGGYGVFGRPQITASRLALQWAIGRELEPDEWALHHCDNPPCVRSSHLFIGTSADNSADRDAKGRGLAGRDRPVTATIKATATMRQKRADGWLNGPARRTHCRHGHEFTPENTYLNGGFRLCRTCRATTQKARRKTA
jgi:hypothetical protein